MIYLHIGKPKTGTSTIQKFLHENRIPLLKQGILYPQIGIQYWGHHNIYYDLAYSPSYDPSLGSYELLIKRMSDYKSKHLNGNFILSSETFCTMHAQLFEKLITGLQQIDEIKVILYLRNQVDYLKSFWSLHVKNNRTQFKFETWAKEKIETNLVATDYLLTINELTSIIDDTQLKIEIYDEIEKEEFINHFLEICNVQAKDSLISLATDIHNASQYKSIEIPEEIRELCYERFNESNREIAKRFLNKDYLFKSMAS